MLGQSKSIRSRASSPKSKLPFRDRRCCLSNQEDKVSLLILVGRIRCTGVQGQCRMTNIKETSLTILIIAAIDITAPDICSRSACRGLKKLRGLRRLLYSIDELLIRLET